MLDLLCLIAKNVAMNLCVFETHGASSNNKGVGIEQSDQQPAFEVGRQKGRICFAEMDKLWQLIHAYEMLRHMQKAASEDRKGANQAA
jgi:hypothetical protein